MMNSPLSPGTRIRYIGDYELLEKLGEGGYGTVYRTRQVSLNRLVALKTIEIKATTTDAQLRRFDIEAQAVAKLTHENIVPIYEVGEHEGQPYFSMMLVEGKDLSSCELGRDLVPRCPTTRREKEAVVHLVCQVAHAIHHAHDQHVIHRDLKPANILINAKTGRPYVTDFGLAKILGEDSGVSCTGEVHGTLGYMAPEQAWGNSASVTAAADIYSLGVILYELLTGMLPLNGRSREETLELLRSTDPKLPSTINREIDRDLDTVCLKCLEKNPSDRLASAEMLVQELERWLRREPIVTRPCGHLEKGFRWLRREPWKALVFAFVLFFAVGIVMWRRQTPLVEEFRNEKTALDSQHGAEYALRLNDINNVVLEIDRRMIPLNTGHIDFIEQSAGVFGVWRWRDFPQLFVAKIRTLSGGSWDKYDFKDMLVVDKASTQLVLRLPWSAEHFEGFPPNTRDQDRRGLPRTTSQKAEYHFDKSNSGNPIIVDTETSEAWEILPNKVTHYLPKRESTNALFEPSNRFWLGQTNH